MSDDDIETVLKAFPSIVEWRKVEEGIAVRPVNQPALEKIVRMSVDVRDRTWNWLHACMRSQSFMWFNFL